MTALNPCQLPTVCPHCGGRFIVHITGTMPCMVCGRLIVIEVQRFDGQTATAAARQPRVDRA